MAEPQALRPMTLDDCEKVSRHISALLDVEDIIAEAYTLEVSSPGIDRPLITAADFDRYKGFEAKAELLEPQNGRKRFRGVIEGVTDNAVTLSMPEGTFILPIDRLQSARLVLTDALIDFTESLYQPTQPVN
jgi:ribosome maturation factor RimP